MNHAFHSSLYRAAALPRLSATITWSGHTLTVPITNPPPVGTRTQVAYNPADPTTAIIPGATIA